MQMDLRRRHPQRQLYEFGLIGGIVFSKAARHRAGPMGLTSISRQELFLLVITLIILIILIIVILLNILIIFIIVLLFPRTRVPRHELEERHGHHS